ncbi:hypothetical protein PVK06_023963 [Gossypium arboreum]|uniref:DUF8040 domain-containing protein n=1 Tax=Gossypium arboreum TaxID=29729 RepID=A0ABR0PCI5_GOSAR|nr:hypothetical protein PVK06_023963 [Gossypium arboreum]
MRPIALFNLCDILSRNNLLQSTKSVNIREQVVIFLHIIGHNVRFRVIGSRYYRSTETIHRYFRVVLRAFLKLYKIVIRLPNESTPSEIRNNPRFYPYFKDCIGALDETHVSASVPLSIQGRFHSRKGGTAQNVLAAITFDLKFSYVLAGWEDIVFACCIIHNHIMGVDLSDLLNQGLYEEPKSDLIISTLTEREEAREWSAKRD